MEHNLILESQASSLTAEVEAPAVAIPFVTVSETQELSISSEAMTMLGALRNK
jgi:hypothetical protein